MKRRKMFKQGFTIFLMLFFLLGLNLTNVNVVQATNGKVSIQFDRNGGLYNGTTNNPNIFQSEIGKTIPEPQPGEFTRSGYDLEGWYTHKTSFTSSTKWDFKNPVTQDLTLYARWVAPPVAPQKITFNIIDNYGQASGSEVKYAEKNGSNVSPSAKPAAISGTYHNVSGGAVFKAFYKDSSFSTQFSSEGYTEDGEDKTIDLWARYVRTLNFNIKGTINKQEIYLDQTGTTNLYTAPPEKDLLVPEEFKDITLLIPYEFNGWYKDSSFKEPFDVSNGSLTGLSFDANGNATIFAKYDRIESENYQITLNYNNGSTPPSLTFQVPKNSQIKLATPGVPTGKVFDGWYLGSTKWDSSLPITSDLVLDAKYYSYITFNLAGGNINGNTTLSPVNIPTDGYLDEPDIPTLSGYTFYGWHSSEGGYIEFENGKSKSVITTSQLLTAVYTNNPGGTNVDIVTITYDNNGGTFGGYSFTQYVQKGSTFANIAIDPTRTSYHFNGWTYNGKPWNFATDIANENIVLKADWLIKYMVEFWIGPGTDSDMRQEAHDVIEGSVIPTPSRTPIKHGAEFLHWQYTDATSGEIKQWDGETTLEITKELAGSATETNTKFRFDAVWFEFPIATLVYDNGSNIEIDIQTYKAEDGKFYIIFPGNPKKNGYEFLGWYDKEGKRYDPYTPVEKSITLTAIWEQGIITTFDPNDKNYNIEKRYARVGDSIYPPQFDTKVINNITYAIISWHKNSDCSDPAIDFQTYTVEREETFYGKWGITDTISVTFMDPYGNQLAETDVLYGETLSYDNAPLPNDNRYIFQNDWYFDYENQLLWNFADGFTTDTTLTACVAHQITFNSNGGTNVASVVVNRGEGLYEPQYPIKYGYIFQGWYKDDAFTTPFNFMGMSSVDLVNEHLTLYAKWLEDKVETPVADLPSGTYYTITNLVTLSCETPFSTIRYTIDGSEPTESSTLYEQPIILSKSMTLKIKAFRPGMTASDTASYDYKVIIPTEGISLDKKEATMVVGEEDLQLTEIFKPENATEINVTWTSSDDTIATVSETGEVHAVKKGVTIITVTTEYDGKIFTDTCEITVVLRNLALFKNASSTAGTTSGSNGPENAVDGKENTRWLTKNNTTDVHLTIDFEKLVTFNQILIYQYDNRIKEYKIQYHDETGWVDIYSGISNTAEITINFEDVTSSRVRLVVVSLHTTYGASINEFEVYHLPDGSLVEEPKPPETPEPPEEPGANLALNKTATASHTSGSNKAKNAIDGNMDTRWLATNNSAGATLEIDFGKATRFNQVKIFEDYKRIDDFSIQYFDGENWIDLYTGNSVGTTGLTIDFEAVESMKIRLLVISLKGTNGASISEFEVYHIDNE